MRYALIKHNVIQNVIQIEDENFLQSIAPLWDHCVRTDTLYKAPKWIKDGVETHEEPKFEEIQFWQYDPGVEEPSIGWTYINGEFFSQEINE